MIYVNIKEKIIGKKAALNLIDTWVDYVALFSLITGVLISFIAGSKVLSLVIVFISGLIVGRWIYFRKYKHQLRFWYPLTGFVLGLIFGSRFLSYKGVLVTFIVATCIGYYLKKNHVLE